MNLAKFLYNLAGAPEYCKWCGCELEECTRPIKFDPHTGKPIKVRVIIRCPHLVHYDTRHFSVIWTEKIEDYRGQIRK